MQRRTEANPGDAHFHRVLSRKLLRAGDHEGAAESHHRAETLENAHDYAQRLRTRVEGGAHDDTTLRRYREALHKAHPDIAEHVKNYAHGHRDERRAQRELEAAPLSARKHRDGLQQHRDRRSDEAASEMDKALHKSKKNEHNLGHFLSPLKSNEKEDDTPEQVRHGVHLSQLNRLVNHGRQGSAEFFSGGRIEHTHYQDEHADPEATAKHAARHAALIGHHFPNARLDVDQDTETWTPRTVVTLHNSHDLSLRDGGASR